MPKWTHECLMSVKYQATRQCTKDKIGWTAYSAATAELYAPIEQTIIIVTGEINAELWRLRYEQIQHSV